MNHYKNLNPMFNYRQEMTHNDVYSEHFNVDGMKNKNNEHSQIGEEKNVPYSEIIEDLINFDELLVVIDDKCKNSKTEKNALFPTEVLLGKVHPFNNLDRDENVFEMGKVLKEFKVQGKKNKNNDISQTEKYNNEPNTKMTEDLICFDESLIVIDEECESSKKMQKPSLIHPEYIDELKTVYDEALYENSSISDYLNNPPLYNGTVVLGKVHPFNNVGKNGHDVGKGMVSPLIELKEAPQVMKFRDKFSCEETNGTKCFSSTKDVNLIDLFENISVTPNDLTKWKHHLKCDNFENSGFVEDITDCNCIKHEFKKIHVTNDSYKETSNPPNNCMDLRTSTTTKDDKLVSVTPHVTIKCEKAYVITPQCSCFKLELPSSINKGPVPKKLENHFTLHNNKERNVYIDKQDEKELDSVEGVIEHNIKHINENTTTNKIIAPKQRETNKMVPIILDENHALTRLKWQKQRVAIDKFIWKK